MDTVATFLVPVGAFLMTLVFGVWLSRKGKPYNGLLFNAHKLIALGTVVVTAVRTYYALEGAEVQALLIALIILAGLCVVALFATGALMSLGKLSHALLLTIHRVALFLAAGAMAAAIYFLGGGSL
jgi:hypothetical protein